MARYPCDATIGSPDQPADWRNGLSQIVARVSQRVSPCTFLLDAAFRRTIERGLRSKAREVLMARLARDDETNGKAVEQAGEFLRRLPEWQKLVGDLSAPA